MTRNEWLKLFIFELENEALRLEIHSVDFSVDYEKHDGIDIFHNDPRDTDPVNTNLDVYRLADKEGRWAIMLFRESWKDWHGGFRDSCNIEIEGDYKKFKDWLLLFKLQNMDMNIQWGDWEAAP